MHSDEIADPVSEFDLTSRVPTRPVLPTEKSREVGTRQFETQRWETVSRTLEQGRVLFGVALCGIGIANLCTSRIVWIGSDSKQHVPVIPWAPSNGWEGYIVGVLLLVAGLVMVAARKYVVPVGLGCGLLFCCYALFVHLPSVIHRPLDLNERTLFCEVLSMAGGCFVIGTVWRPNNQSPSSPMKIMGLVGRWMFAITLVVFGVDHLLIPKYIAFLVPLWLPWALFWAYATGLALMCAGFGIVTGWRGRGAGFLAGVLFLSWVLTLHLPRTLGLAKAGAGPRSPAEWSSLLIAIAMTGASWAVGLQLSSRSECSGRA